MATQIRINQQVDLHKKYAEHTGQSFWVFDSIDNKGDYCLIHGYDVPFVFINKSDCKVIKTDKKTTQNH